MKRVLCLAAVVAAAGVGSQSAGAGGTPALVVPAGFSARTLVIDGSITPFSLGISIGFDAAGHLLVATLDPTTHGDCNGSNGQLYRIDGDSTATPLLQPNAGLDGPQQMAIGSGGVWGDAEYIADSNAGTNCGGKTFRVEADGSLTTIVDHSIPPLAQEPRGLAFGDGAMWIAEATSYPNIFTQPDNGQIERVDAPGDFPVIVASGLPFGDPHSLAFGPGGAWGTDLYIGDIGEAAAGGVPPSIERLDPATGSVTVFSRTPVGRIAFAPPGPFGGLLYANSRGKYIVAVDPSGNATTFATLVNSSANLVGVAPSPDGQRLYVLLEDADTGTTMLFEVTPTAPPAPTLTAPAEGALLGSSSVPFAGTAEPNATVHVLVDGIESGTTTADAAGTFTGTVTVAPDGTHAITATQEVNAVRGPASAARDVTVDTTPPAIVCPAADGAWHGDNVRLSCTAADATSGLADPANDAAFTLATSVASDEETANAATGTHEVCDRVGHCATAGPITGNHVDRKPPAVVVTAPAATTYLLDERVPASYSCSDGGSGVATCNGPVAVGADVDTAAVGVKTFRVDAADAVGNTSNSSTTYTVTYAIAPLFDQAKRFGGHARIRVALTDAAGTDVSAPSIAVNAVSLDGVPLQAAFTFRQELDGGQGAYLLTLPTHGLAAGSHSLAFTAAGDPVNHSISFSVH